MKRLEVLGLDEKKVQHVVVDLSLLLADLQVFYSNLRGFHWESRFSAYLEVAEIKEAGVVSCSKEAVDLLLDYYKTLIARERRIIDLATEAHDDTTVSLMNDFLVQQEKTVWMLVAVSSQSCAE